MHSLHHCCIYELCCYLPLACTCTFTRTEQYAIPTRTLYLITYLGIYVWDGHLLGERQKAHTRNVYDTSYLPSRST